MLYRSRKWLASLIALAMILTLNLISPPEGVLAAEYVAGDYNGVVEGFKANKTGSTLNIGWGDSNMGDRYAEGDWVPYQLVIYNIGHGATPSLYDLPEIFVEYATGDEGGNPPYRFIDLVRGFQVKWTNVPYGTIDPDDFKLQDASETGYPDMSEYTTAGDDVISDTDFKQLEEAQIFGGHVPLWDSDWADIDVPTEQINVGAPTPNGDGTNTYAALDRSDLSAFFYITADDLDDAGVGDDVTMMIIYFQMHLARTSLWRSGLYEAYGHDDPAEADEAYDWGGWVYGTDEFAFNPEFIVSGAKEGPGSSTHVEMYSEVPAQIPAAAQPYAQVSGYKWEDTDFDGVKDDGETPLVDWPIYISAELEGIPFVLTTKTDSTGFYSFPTLTYGRRWLTEGSLADPNYEAPRDTGWSQTAPNSGSELFNVFDDFYSEVLDNTFDGTPDGDGYQDYLNSEDMNIPYGYTAPAGGFNLAPKGYVFELTPDIPGEPAGNYIRIGMNFGNAISLPDIHIDKKTNGEDDGGYIHVGDPVTWTYLVTNTGNVPLHDVEVSDSESGVNPVASVQDAGDPHPGMNIGDLDGNGLLDLAEEWTFTATGTAVAGLYENTGTADGKGPLDEPVTDTDTSGYFGSNPAIHIEKVTNGSDGPYIHVGDPVTWTYTVTNTGNVPLHDVVVTDNKPGVTPAAAVQGGTGLDAGLNIGDINDNGKLDLTESWIFTATGTAVAGQYNNTGDADGKGPADDAVNDDDTSSYFGSQPGIHIEKVTNGSDGPFIHFGDPVTWTYTVTNTGNVPLHDVVVTDDHMGVTPAATVQGGTGPDAGLNIGDINDNGKLDLTESWTFTASGTAVAGLYENTGDADGKGPANDAVNDDDTSSYFGSNPGIHIEKVTNGSDGPYIHVGDPVTWTYTVTNTGNVPLHDVVVTDNKPGVTPAATVQGGTGPDAGLNIGDTNDDGKLDTTETWIFTATGTAVAGQYNNTGDADGKGPADDAVNDDDTSSYFGSQPGIHIEKVTNGSDGPYIHVGDPVTWTYTVTNTGNVPLHDVVVTDNKPGVTPAAAVQGGTGLDAGLNIGDTNDDGKLDLTESWTFTASGTAVAGLYENTGDADGKGPANDTVNDDDTSSYFGSNPGIHIEKVTNGSDGPYIHVGDPVTWTYTVTNTGNVPLHDVVVTDNKPGVTPAATVQGAEDDYPGKNIGDTNGDGKLDTTESWIFTATGTAVAGLYENTGDADGKGPADDAVNDDDTSSYFGSNPGIHINKITIDGSQSGDALVIQIGHAITWRYTVTNTGNVPLHDVDVTDNQTGGDPDPVLQGLLDDHPFKNVGDLNGDDKLDLTEVWIFEASGTAVGGSYINTGRADGKGPVDDAVFDTDSSSYIGKTLVKLIKTIDGAPYDRLVNLTFQIRQGASLTQAGTILETGIINSTNQGIFEFTLLYAPGTYQLVEQVPLGLTPDFMLDPDTGDVLPYGYNTWFKPTFEANEGSLEDNALVAVNFVIQSDGTIIFQPGVGTPGRESVGLLGSIHIDNQTPPGDLPLTIGFWKNHSSAKSSMGNQEPVLDFMLYQAGQIQIGDLVLYGGTNPFVATDAENAVRLLNKSRISDGKKMASDPAFNLAAQLLAYRLNKINNSWDSTVAAQAAAAGQSILDLINFNGITHNNINKQLAANLNYIASVLDAYNNGTLSFPAFVLPYP